MAITYPLTMPATPVFESLIFKPISNVAKSTSVFTGQQQVYAHRGQWWEVEFSLPAMLMAKGAPWFGFFAALNGLEGTFSLGDYLRRNSQGTQAGSLQVGAGASLGSTTLPLQGGTGTLAVGDWIQVGTSLYSVIQVNAGSVDVFPRLRAAHAQTTTVVYSNAKGLFRLQASVPFRQSKQRLFEGVNVSAIEAI